MSNKPDNDNNESKTVEILKRIRAQYDFNRAMSARFFRSALIWGVLFTIFWTVIGQLIPPGNWMIAYNIVMLLISIWIIAPTTISFFRMRMDWMWLAIILSAIVYLAIVVGIKTFIINMFYE